MSNNKSLISIIVPVYNVEKYLKRCLDSIINQSYKNLEIICVDDGSTDDSGKICDEYALKDNRIKVMHKENGGLASARNAGLKIASGQYISAIDSDDWIEPQTYQCVMDIMIKFNPDLIKWGNYLAYGSGKRFPNPIVFNSGFAQGQAINEFIYDVITFKAKTNNIWAALFKKEIIENYNLRTPEEIVQGEDLYFLVSYLLHCKSIYVLSKDYFYNYFVNPLSLSRKCQDLNTYVNERLILIEEMSKLTSYNTLLGEALSIRVTNIIFVFISFTELSAISFENKITALKTVMRNHYVAMNLKRIKFTKALSQITRLPAVYLAYKGYFRLSLYSIKLRNKVKAVYRYIAANA
jgi:glycosyltransferase involved in cell wall biosynthesis